MSNGRDLSAHPEKRLFIASFLVLIAAGIGFSIRGGILRDWGAQFGFTQGELGVITGFGLTGFGITIIFFSLFADRWGYGPLMAITFTFHLLSAIITVMAGPIFVKFGKPGAFWCLAVGTTMFALGNGTSEAVINPLTATLYPRQKTHYLNILHAGWPGGLIVGAILGVFLIGKVHWEVALLTYLIPTLIYGFMMLGQSFPHSEARVHGVKLGTMLREFASPILLFLLLLHAMVGYVELGTDSWISNITGNIMADPQKGLYLFIWTSGLMFALRFFAGPIVHKISPLGLLCVGAICGTIGLLLLGGAKTIGMCIIAATIYGFGKTYYWPTMLGVVSERFPRGGALTLGAMGGVGMLSAGLLGTPGIGYKQDYFATKDLQQGAPATYERYKSETTRSFLFFPAIAGLDGAKVATLNDNAAQLSRDLATVAKAGKTDPNLEKLNAWWQSARDFAAQDKAPVNEASLQGGRMALKWTALVPAMMAVGFFMLILYFKAKGGYRQVHIDDEKMTGGVEGPVEA